MDLKVYKKERVSQPSGTEEVYVPGIIDIYPELIVTDEEVTVLKNASLVEDKEELEQAVALSTIWQRGLDPLDEGSGNRWSELYLDEINIVQIMDDITTSVEEVSPSVTVEFDTVTDASGNNLFSYKIKVVS